MRIAFGDINVYYFHDELTPANVRAAVYGSEYSSALIPEVGDVLHDFPGWTAGEFPGRRDGEHEPITVRVTAVAEFGDSCTSYEVRTTTIEEG
jgi:hypothetical protein